MKINSNNINIAKLNVKIIQKVSSGTFNEACCPGLLISFDSMLACLTLRLPLLDADLLDLFEDLKLVLDGFFSSFFFHLSTLVVVVKRDKILKVIKLLSKLRDRSSKSVDDPLYKSGSPVLG